MTRIETFKRLGTRCALPIAALLLVCFAGCSDGAGTEQVEGLFPPESEIDRMYPDTGDGDGDTGDGDGDEDAGTGDGDGDTGDGDGDEDAGMD